MPYKDAEKAREKSRECSRAWKERNREKHLAAHRERMAVWRSENREADRARTRAWTETKGKETSPEREANFWSHVEKTETCWLWTGASDRQGYGLSARVLDEVLAHRIAWRIMRSDEDITGLELHHSDECPNHCVNPSHLQAMTPDEHTAHHACAARLICS